MTRNFMAKLWNKTSDKLNKIVEEFETGEDLVLDKYMIEADVYGSFAHAFMLSTIGLLTKAELTDIQKGLLKILELHKQGKFNLDFGDEDVHTKIENFLTQTIGKAGKKIHAGRSRNDQILLDMRIYTKSELLKIWDGLLDLTSVLANLSEKYSNLPMPGYTHMQKAMPSSVGMWFGSFAESLLDDAKVLQTAFDLNDQSPLGSGAGYGVSLNLDRKLVADFLGFKKVQTNSLYCQNSRGKIESVIGFALLQIIFDISKLASDILLFTTSEFNFFEVDISLFTGSSIMPRKKNVDIAELLRSKVNIMLGYLIQIFTTVVNLPSGYNRDFQDIKRPFIESINLTKNVLKIAKILVKNIKPKEEILIKAMTTELYAAHIAHQLVEEGVAFREAYKKVDDIVNNFPIFDPYKILKMSKHIGGTANLQGNAIKKNLARYRKILFRETKNYNKILLNFKNKR